MHRFSEAHRDDQAGIRSDRVPEEAGYKGSETERQEQFVSC